MTHINGLRLKTLIGAMALLGLTACGGGGSGGGDGLINDINPEDGTNPDDVVVSDVVLRGTTTSERLFASNIVEVRAQSGELSTGTFDNTGRFIIENLQGTGPYLVRTDLGNEAYLYAIAVGNASGELVQNVHSYTDAVARNWFAQNNIDIDQLFASTGLIANLPTSANLSAINNQLSSVVEDVLDDYEIASVDLDTVEFVADGTGVDAFVTQNPIIINGGNITINIFDQDNETQSIATANLSLSTDLTLADTQAPTPPSRVRALPSASDEITLVWDVATDNIGIARYAIFRDGTQVATSPFPVYVDGGLDSDGEFAFTIVAIDGAGNESSETAAVTASPLAALDTTPPPTPSRVEIDTRTGSLDVTWTQTSVNDVASFAIRRGNSAANLAPFTSVSSTFLFDSRVNAGAQFCYTVQAVDASGNASDETDVVCATVPGTSIGDLPPIDTTPPVTPPVATGSDLTAPLVDVSGLDCSAELPETFISVNTTIAAGCYTTFTSVTVLEPARLTLEPGVVIRFGSSDGIIVGSGASLTADGTVANPIVLTGVEPTPGFWSGLTFSGSNSVNNILNHAQVEYAGGTARLDAGVELDSSSRVSITNSTMRGNSGAGLSIDDNARLSMLDGNRYTENDISVRLDPEAVNILDSRSDYTGNRTEGIEITSTVVQAETTWANHSVPYIIDSLTVNETMIVEAGTTMLFENDGGITINSGDASIEMNGTAAEPILLDRQSNRWEGINIRFTSADNQLTYVTIANAGDTSGDQGSLRIGSNTGTTTRLGMNNVTIRDGSGFGIDADTSTIFTEFENITITGNAALAQVDIYAAQIFNNPGSFTGNTVDTIEIRSTNVNDGDVVLSNSDVPYIAENLSVRDGFTLEAGVSLLMGSGAVITVSGNGFLIADGTAAQPVSVIGQQRIAGFWDGIDFDFAPSPVNRLTNTLLADGGGSSGADAANARLDCNGGTSSRLTVENSRIENSAGFGIHVDTTGCELTLDNATTFTNNADGAVGP